MKPYLEKRFEVYHGVADLYSYFFERGLRLLKPGGRLGYISSSTFFKTGAGRPLRNQLRKKATLESVVNFGDLQIFEGVTTYPAILVIRRSIPNSEHEIRFWNVEGIPDANFVATFENLFKRYPQSQLGADSWEFETADLNSLRNKIIIGKLTLKEVYGSPSYGIKTGRNDAFIVDRKTRDALINEDPHSEEILKPVLKGNELKRWRIESDDNWLIFTRRGVDIQFYPAVERYLQQFRTVLEPKPKNWEPRTPDEKWPGRKAGPYKWYEIQDTIAYHEQFLCPKISYIEICSKGPFSFDDSGFYQEATTFMIPNADRFLLALLNSKPIWFYWVASTTILRGGYQRMKNQYVEPVPIPDATDAQKNELAALAEACQTAAEQRYALQHALVRRIPDLASSDTDPRLTTKLKEWWLLPDFAAFQAEVKKCLKAEIPLKERNEWEDWIAKNKAEIVRLTAEIKTNEDRINAIVYELFDLTPDEIVLLEANI